MYAKLPDLARALFTLAAIDPDAVAAVTAIEDGRRPGQATIARRLAEQGYLRDDVGVDEATDILNVITSFQAFDELFGAGAACRPTSWPIDSSQWPSAPSAGPMSDATMPALAPTPESPPSERRLRELAFLHDIARLATLARDWDELMRAIVDGTTTALGVEVCSFYLADRDQPRLTLAATNGLDRTQVGRVSLAVGQGITGRVAESREPIAVEDVTVDPRFAWVRGFDVEGLHAMLSVPLVWHDRVIGVLNVQTRRPAAVRRRRRRPAADDRRAARRDRREGPSPGRGRGPSRRADRARRRPGRADVGRDPRAADAARRGPGLRRAARGAAADEVPRPATGRRRRSSRSRGSTTSSTRSLPRSAARA